MARDGHPRILIINPFGIGDVLFSTPLVRAIRKTFPSAYIAYLGNRRTEEILCRNPNLDELFVYEKDEFTALWDQSRWGGLRALLRLSQRVHRRRIGLVIDLSLGERYSLLLKLMGVRQRVGFDFRHRGRFLTHRLVIDGYQDRHVVEYYARLLAMIGIRLLDRRFELRLSQTDAAGVTRRLTELGIPHGHRLIGLIPAGGVSWGIQANFRRWSEHGFVHVSRALSQQYPMRILVFGESRDRSVCAQIAQAIGPAAIDLSGRTSLGEFVGLIGRCELVIANDGGPVHIAASQGVKTVSIFGPVDPMVYGPYPLIPSHRFVYKSDLPCRPCYHRFKLPPCPYERACLSEITPEDVLEACHAALA